MPPLSHRARGSCPSTSCFECKLNSLAQNCEQQSERLHLIEIVVQVAMERPPTYRTRERPLGSAARTSIMTWPAATCTVHSAEAPAGTTSVEA
jgi:hypothetical protein